MKKKILTLCMAMLLVTQLFPVAHAADKASTTVSVDFRASAVISNGETEEGENLQPSAPMKYDSIVSALEDLKDGKFSLYDGALVYVVSRTYPVKITITADQTIEQKVVLSAKDAEAESLDSGASLDVNFPEIVITTTKGSRTVNFSNGLEVQSGASLILDNNLTDKKGASITYSFGAPVTVSGSLKFEGNSQQLGTSGGTEGSVNFTDGANLTVESGGEVTAASVAITGSDTTSPLLVVKEGGKLDFVTAGASSYGTIQTSGTAIQVDGGDVTIGAGKITSNNGSAVVANSGNVTVEKGGIKDVTTPEISSTGASSIAVGNGAELTVSSGNISNNDGKPAISVAENATLKIPTESTAQITTSNENGQAIDLAGGSKVQKGDTTITVGADGDSYVDNDGSIILGAGSSVTDPNGTTELPNGGSVDQDGDVTQNALPAESISLNQTSVTLYSNTTPNAVQLIANVTPDNTTDPVAWSSDNEAVATVNESGLVTAVSNGSATITVTAGNVSAACTVTVTTYTSGGSSSDDDDDPTYSVTLPKNVKGGEIKTSHRYAEQGNTVTITVDPDKGYELDELTVTDSKGKELDLTDKGNGKYAFKMPGTRVEVEVSFKLIETEPEAPAFADVPASAYYADAVAWAVEQGITSGTSATTFSPDMSCTRAQIVTFLWRANGSPKADGANPFTDVSADAYYYDAVLWAVKEGITSGTSTTTFAPDMTVTRGQTVTFLYRAAGAPAVSGGSFADVAADAYYADAVAWAVKEGITSGTGGNSFSPDAPCTRGQIVTFLYRDAK